MHHRRLCAANSFPLDSQGIDSPRVLVPCCKQRPSQKCAALNTPSPFRSLGELVTIDFARLHVGAFFALGVLFLSMIAYSGKGDKIARLNKLREDRTELDNIRRVELGSNGTHLIASLEIDAIYPQSITQHFKFLTAAFQCGFMNSTVKPINSLNEDSPESPIIAIFPAPTAAKCQVVLERSREPIGSGTFEFRGVETENSSLMFEGEYVAFSNVCVVNRAIQYFSIGQTTFAQPFMGNGEAILSVISDPKLSFEKQKARTGYSEESRIGILSNTRQPSNWNFLVDTVAPLVRILRDYPGSPISFLPGPTADRQELLERLFGKSIPYESVCLSDLVIPRFSQHPGDLELLRNTFLEKVSGDVNGTVVIVENSGNFSDGHQVLGTDESLSRVAEAVAKAEHSFCLSEKCSYLSLFARGDSFVQLLPDQNSCRQIFRKHHQRSGRYFGYQSRVLKEIESEGECGILDPETNESELFNAVTKLLSI